MSEELKMDQVKQLISIGKEKGYLTYEEVNDFLPDNVVSSGEIDDIFIMFNEMDINIIDEAEKTKYVEEKFESEEKISDLGFSELNEEPSEGFIGRTDDPVRLYLREMGTVPLLTREDEVRIAKRIEMGKQKIIKAISNTQIAYREIKGLKNRLIEGRMSSASLKDINGVNENEGDSHFEDSEGESVNNFIKMVEVLENLEAEVLNLQLEIGRKDVESVERQNIKRMIHKKQAQIIKIVRMIPLDSRQINKIVGRIKLFFKRIEVATKERQQNERELGISYTTVEQIYEES